MKFSPQIKAVQFPPITEVKSWLAGIDVGSNLPLLDLCQAVPDYAPAPQLIDYLSSILADPMTSRYSPDEGLEEVRASVSAWYGRRYGSAPAMDEICLTIGASQAFWLAIMTLCEAGDEVIVQQPAYFDHPMALQSLGIRPVWVPFDQASGGQPDLQAIAARITARTRAILLVTPSNPTGAVTSPQILTQLLALAKQHDIALILDETYNAFLSSSEPPHSLFKETDWQQHFIHIASFGKTFALTGYRAGALVAGSEVIHQALKVQDTMAVCQPRITQLAIRFGCDNLDDWVAANAAMMQRRHDLFCSTFKTPGNPFELLASGSFFAWVRHPWPQLSSREAARRLLESCHLICLPGEAFGPGLRDCLRLALGNLREDDIAVAVKRFVQTKADTR